MAVSKDTVTYAPRVLHFSAFHFYEYKALHKHIVHHTTVTLHKYVHMLGPKHGFEQSTDVSAQSMDPCFVQQSMDSLLILWIAQIEERQV